MKDINEVNIEIKDVGKLYKDIDGVKTPKIVHEVEEAEEFDNSR